MTPIPTILETLTPTHALLQNISSIPSQPATIDTLISTFSFYSTVILGIFGLLLAVIAGLGGFLVWNGFILRARAEKDLDRIEETATKSEKIFAEYKRKTDEAFKAADEVISTLINVASVLSILN